MKSKTLRLPLKNLMLELIVILYSGLMIYAAISKLSDYTLSREQLAMMPLLAPVANIMAWALPSVEIIIGCLMFIPQTRLKGLYSVTFLMIIFTIYIIFMMTNYAHLPCSCGGLLQELTWKQHLVFNSVFILLGVIAIYLQKNKMRNSIK